MRAGARPHIRSNYDKLHKYAFRLMCYYLVKERTR